MARSATIQKQLEKLQERVDRKKNEIEGLRTLVKDKKVELAERKKTEKAKIKRERVGRTAASEASDTQTFDEEE